MKKILYIFIPVFICSISVAQSVPNFIIIEGDTVNLVDENNLKQGFWKIFGKMRKLPRYEPDQVIEQGKYANSRKQGLWTKFFPSGKTKSEIEYKNSRPNGSYRTYFENGQVEEEGNWKNNRNTNDFKRYYENGQVSQNFAFNTSGKRNGRQTYFYENGQVMIEADIESGKEKFVKEYYEDGSIKAEKNFIDGKLDVVNTKVYESKTPVKEKGPEGVVEIVTVDKTEKSNTGSFHGEGQHKMYNANRQISKDGFFKAYRLIDGKWYIYDGNGILTKIKRFKSGRYIGDSPLPK
ncbi:MAG: toxin-antitoxin system YwqK family antitoxin [Flavobacteriales bacterium]|nr:toxin-antitoxin system YwqK family antitoxin [Flavobacteriales bacterium]NQX97907.1 toxin-antitoxin system YwqK family antitoxin [Flavobacteriales bacterium]